MKPLENRHPDEGLPASTDFIRTKIAEDLRTDKYHGRVATRFPPEPNGYLHIGHAKSICLNFGIALENQGGTCNLRFDDTNPETEEMKYVESIQEDVRWLGFDWEDRLFFASDYFERLYTFAVKLIKDGNAYVDSLKEAEIREYRGTVTTPGRESPYRGRSIEENLDMFERMRAGEFENGAHVLRAKIDMTLANMQMRDPVLYRIRHAEHYRTGNDWCVYPLYDFTHCLSDALERITHSLCTLEFKDNRALYDWIVNAVGFETPPEQTEFARLNLDYTVVSKRKLVQLVRDGHVDGWDDPRMPTIAGFRRRGVTPEAIRTFCDTIGVAKVDSRVDIEKLEHAILDDLNMRVPRVMCVLRPLKVVIDNYPEDQVEELDAPFYPHDVPKEGSRKVPFSRVLYIERDDFMEEPPKKFFRLAPGREVRLRYAYLVTCKEVIKDPETGEVIELRCNYDPDSRGGNPPDGRKVKGTLHWVSAEHSLPAEVRLYDRLFLTPNPEVDIGDSDFTANLNHESIEVLRDSRVEPAVAHDQPGTRYQFERTGYFCSDAVDSTPEQLVFNRTVSLRDTWAKMVKADAGKSGVERADLEEKTASVGAAGRSNISKQEAERTPEFLAKLERYTAEFGLTSGDAEIILDDQSLVSLFDEACAAYENPKAIAKWLVNDLRYEAKGVEYGDLPLTGATLASLVQLVEDNTITRTNAKEVFGEMARSGGDPVQIVREKGLEQLADFGSLEPLVDKVLAENEAKVAEYRAGRLGLLGMFVGQVMRDSGGKANPGLVKELVQKKLG
ncbi:glutamine--tRNA ligase/YqeY domain fusion protein [Gemmatimonadota bacterium]